MNHLFHRCGSNDFSMGYGVTRAGFDTILARSKLRLFLAGITHPALIQFFKD